MKKKTIFSTLLALVMLCALCLFASCGQVTVTLSQNTASILIGETVTLTATVSDEEAEVVWSTGDESVATVKNGTVKGVKEGKTTITATVGEVSASCEVTVSGVEVTMSETKATVERGQTLALTATASDDGKISWSSSDTAVATVSDSGVVTALAEGTTTVTAKRGAAGSATCEVTVVWTSKPADYALIANGDEAAAAAAPGSYIYWNDQGWCGTNVTVTKAEYGNGTATFSYSDSNSACWFGMQIFYKNATNVVGERYNLTCTITSEAEGDITVNGTVVTLKKGANEVSVFYTETAVNVNGIAAASLSIQCGNSVAGTVVEANTFSISNLKFAKYAPEKLSVPTAVSIAADKTVTVTDANGSKASGFKLYFCDAGGAVKYEQTVQNGDKIEDSVMEDGTYGVKVSAVGEGMYITSDASAVLANYTVSNGGVTYDLFAGGAAEAVANAGKFFYWTEFAGIDSGKYENGTLKFSVVNGGNWYSNQIFYKNSALTAGTTYKLSFKLNSTAAGHITINGTVVELVAGDNNINVTYTESGDPSFSMQIGIYEGSLVDITAAEFTITDIAYTPAA